MNCRHNDPVDIRAGGPRILGFDFFCEDDAVDQVVSFVKEKLVEYSLPLMDVSVVNASERAVVSTPDFITSCIRDGY